MFCKRLFITRVHISSFPNDLFYEWNHLSGSLADSNCGSFPLYLFSNCFLFACKNSFGSLQAAPQRNIETSSPNCWVLKVLISFRVASHPALSSSIAIHSCLSLKIFLFLRI